MIVGNPCVYDTRVIKEAETLARGGYDVRVLCQKADGVADVETRNGVEYVRVPMSVLIPSITRLGRRTRASITRLGRRTRASITRLGRRTRASIIRLGRGLCRGVKNLARQLLETTFGSSFGSPATEGISHSRSSRAILGHVKTVALLLALWVYSLLRVTEPMGRLAKRAPVGFLRYRVVGPMRRFVRQTAVAFLGYRVVGPMRRIVRQTLVAFLRYRAMHSVVAEQVPRFHPDIIHAHDLLPFPAAVRCASRIGAAVVYDSHELECHRNGQTYVARCIARFLERHNIGRAALVITVCDSIADHLADAYGISRPVVVMNAPTVIAPQSNGETIRSTLGLSETTALGIYVGKTTINRGLEQLVQALAYCANIHVALLGPKHAPTERAVIALADKLGVRSRLHILDSVPPDSVVSYISSADFGVIPTHDVCLSYRFSLPNKLFEMTFARLPICVSDLPEQRAFVERIGNGVLMDEKDPKDIARALRETYERRFELMPSETRMKALVRDYSWDAQAQRLLDAYQDVLSGVDPSMRSFA